MAFQGIRSFIENPARAWNNSAPTQQDVWNRENERFDKEAQFISAQNAESRNHEFLMAHQANEHALDMGTQAFGNQFRLNAQQHGFNMATMQHMDTNGSVGEFHANGMPSRYVPKSSGAFEPEGGPSAPKPVAESRNQAASAGVQDVQGGPQTKLPATGVPIQRGIAGVSKPGNRIGDLPR